jgi:hypothetical protein
MYYLEILYWGLVLKSLEKIQDWLKWTEILGVLHEDLTMFLYLAGFFLDGEGS